MSETKSKKGRSVAAFMFLPQFNLCFEGFAHLIPVFMRTLAVMFAQAGLIPNNHPATRYGIEGVRKYKFTELMGEAWFTLRTTRATPYQWGMFSSVVLMIGFVVCSIGSFFLSIFFNLGAVAQAQLFDHPGNPYGTGETDADQAASFGGFGGVFDTRYSEAPGTVDGASTDYALMVLDKVLRQGAMGTGGSSQLALQPLMETYNAGVLVVAGIMLFWMIISIVVDTAKTGVVGGGRHNMVWAPIRVVFALGIMIPLGTTGFSSGQFMVMKLAEWGSNFGTQIWMSYINSAANTQNLLPAFRSKAVAGLVNGVFKIKTCEMAYNAYVDQAGGGADSLIGITSSTNLLTGVKTINYTNKQGTKSICGSIWYSASATPSTTASLTGALSTVAGTSYQLNQAALDFTNDVRLGVRNVLDLELYPANILNTQAKTFACAFGFGHFSDGGTGVNPINSANACGGSSTGSPVAANPAACGADVLPGTGCHKAAIDGVINTFDSAVNGARNALENDANGYLTTGIKSDMEQRGWGGMGMWYQIVAVLTKLSKNASEITGGYNPGSAWTAESKADIDTKVASIMQSYDAWWEVALSSETNAGIDANNYRDDRNKSLNAGGETTKSTVTNLAKKAADAATDGVAETIMQTVFPADAEDFVFDIIDGSGDNVYPMAAVSATGDQITATGFVVITAVSALGLLDCPSMEASFLGFGVGGSLGCALSKSALANGLASMATALVVAGMVLSFYIPVLPAIRVAFAVLTWIISVFEAVCMVPIAALAHLSSEGDGIAGGAKHAWILWLNVLLRPAFVVLGFVGALLIYNTFIVYWQVSFSSLSASLSATSTWYGKVVGWFAYSLIYVAVLYSAANMIFKMLDMIPNAFMRYMGGSADTSFDDHDSAGYMVAGSNMMNSFKSTRNPSQKDKPTPGPGTTKA